FFSSALFWHTPRGSRRVSRATRAPFRNRLWTGGRIAVAPGPIVLRRAPPVALTWRREPRQAPNEDRMHDRPRHLDAREARRARRCWDGRRAPELLARDARDARRARPPRPRGAGPRRAAARAHRRPAGPEAPHRRPARAHHPRDRPRGRPLGRPS